MSGYGLTRNRVVAVVVGLDDGTEQVGSGYLMGDRLVLTAEHATRNKDTSSKAGVTGVRVVEIATGACAELDGPPMADPDLDVAVLTLRLPDGGGWPTGLPGVDVWGVDRAAPGVLADCAVIGLPRFTYNPGLGLHGSAELHGIVHQTDGAETGHLLMREPIVHGVTDPLTGRAGWGGLSGALVFYKSRALGVVVEHHPPEGDNSLRLIGFDKITGNPDLRALLGLPEKLPAAPTATSGGPILAGPVEVPVEPLTGLVDLLDEGDLPRVHDLDPYQLGATPTEFGNADTYGENDPYVPRSARNVDSELRAAMQPRRLVLLVGPSKAGKTRTMFEAVHNEWSEARLVKPDPAALARVVAHPRLAATTDPLVLWLDDLERFLNSAEPLTPAVLAGLFARPGNTVAVATIREDEILRFSRQDTGELGRSRQDTDELGRSRRQVLESAASTTFHLAPTRDSPDEDAAARAAYPGVDMSNYGLAEQLTGARLLLDQYQAARESDPLLHAVIQAAIDWTRAGMPAPIPTGELRQLAQESLWYSRPDVDDPTETDLDSAIRTARKPPKDVDGRQIGPVPFLSTLPREDHTRAYLAFSYLVAADEGQVLSSRPIPDHIWKRTAQVANAAESLAIADSAYFRGLDSTAISVLTPPAAAGNRDAMYRLGYILSTPSTIYEDGEYKDSPHTDPVTGRRWLEESARQGSVQAMEYLGWLSADADPPDLVAARDWWGKAAALGGITAMTSLGTYLANADPPDLDAARDWWAKAAALGQPDAMTYLGTYLANADPPDLDAARDWWAKAAALGQPDAMDALGHLHQQEDPPDLDAARYWWAKAAALGQPGAMHALGSLFANADPPDLDTAGNWWLRAAELGHPDSMKYLGDVCLQAEVPDLPGARTWYERAAAAGSEDAMYDLGCLSESADPPELDVARDWWLRAAKGGQSNAMLALGDLHQKAEPPDLAEARTWYERAAAAGSRDAMYNLGCLSESAEPPELDAARDWWLRAAALGESDAMHCIGWLAEVADPPDLDAARDWWLKAAALDNAHSMLALGDLCLEEDPPNPIAARDWYMQAAVLGNTEAEARLRTLPAT